MNEKLQYATMLEIPVSTANITYKPKKYRRKAKRKDRSPEEIKEELLLKVNSETEKADIGNTERAEIAENAEIAQRETEEPAYVAEPMSANVHKKAKKPFFKFSAVTVEIIAVFALIATIFLTNAFYADSAINVFMRKVFSPNTAATAAVTEKTYDKFAPVMNFNGEMTVDNGIISFTGSGAVYSPCDGKVSSVVKEENGTYTMNIAHSGVFSSKISGLSYAYLSEGDSVYGNIPVGYVKDDGLTMCFNSQDALIKGYTIENNAVLWAV